MLRTQETANSDRYTSPSETDKCEEFLCDLPNRNKKLHFSILQQLIDHETAPLATRPLRSPSSCSGCEPLIFDRESPLASTCQRWSSWAQLFTRRLWTFGYQEQALASIFDALPADFCATIQTASERVWRVMQSSSHSRAPLAVEGAGEGGMESGEHSFLECLEDIWERDGEEGFIEFVFDPATQQRVNVILNSRTSTLAGMHKEEVGGCLSRTFSRWLLLCGARSRPTDRRCAAAGAVGTTRCTHRVAAARLPLRAAPPVAPRRTLGPRGDAPALGRDLHEDGACGWGAAGGQPGADGDDQALQPRGASDAGDGL